MSVRLEGAREAVLYIAPHTPKRGAAAKILLAMKCRSGEILPSRRKLLFTPLGEGRSERTTEMFTKRFAAVKHQVAGKPVKPNFAELKGKPLMVVRGAFEYSHTVKKDTKEVYICTKCPEVSYLKPADYSRHMRDHHDDQSHCWKGCKGVWASASNMMKHYREHHVAGQEVCVCTTCDYKTRRPFVMKQHVLTHLPMDQRPENPTYAVEKKGDGRNLYSLKA